MNENDRIEEIRKKAKEAAKELLEELPEDMKEVLREEKTLGNPENLTKPEHNDE